MKWLFVYLFTMGCVIAFINNTRQLKMSGPSDSESPVVVFKFVPGPEEKTAGTSEKTKIILHSTKNYNWYAGAEFHRIYMDTTDRDVSWHFTICGDTIYQHFPINTVTWHAGKTCNMDGIGIELCEVRDSCNEDYRQQTIESLDILLLALNEKLHNAVPEIIFHQDCTGKNCPDQNWRHGIFNPVDSASALVLEEQIK